MSARDALDFTEGVVAESTSLVLPEKMSFKEWEKVGKGLAAVSDFSQLRLPWYIGDWVIYGQAKFPDIYSQALEFSGLVMGTLYNYVWTCRNVPASVRREKLGISMHTEVAKIKDPAIQDKWLSEAEVNGWSKMTLRRAIMGIEEPKCLPDRVKPWEEIEAEKVEANVNIEPSKLTCQEWYEENQERLEQIPDEYETIEFIWSEAQRNK